MSHIPDRDFDAYLKAMPQSARKAVGIAGLLIYLTAFIALAAMLGERILAHAPWWAALVYFAAAGVAWALPLKPLFGWMNKP